MAAPHEPQRHRQGVAIGTNLAARLGDHVNGGEFLRAPQTAQRVRDLFLLRSVGPISLKNLSSPEDAWRVQAGHPAIPVVQRYEVYPVNRSFYSCNRNR